MLRHNNALYPAAAETDAARPRESAIVRRTWRFGWAYDWRDEPRRSAAGGNMARIQVHYCAY